MTKIKQIEGQEVKIFGVSVGTFEDLNRGYIIAVSDNGMKWLLNLADFSQGKYNQ